MTIFCCGPALHLLSATNTKVKQMGEVLILTGLERNSQCPSFRMLYRLQKLCGVSSIAAGQLGVKQTSTTLDYYPSVPTGDTEESLVKLLCLAMHSIR
jgi:hypothetical protein